MGGMAVVVAVAHGVLGHPICSPYMSIGDMKALRATNVSLDLVDPRVMQPSIASCEAGQLLATDY